MRLVKIFQKSSKDHAYGLFLAIDEGYYRITVNLRSSPDSEVHLHADILKDNVESLAFCDTDGWRTTNMYTLVYLELYQSFQVRIRSGTIHGLRGSSVTWEGVTQNLIQVEKIS